MLVINKYFPLLFIISGFIFLSCASKGAPSGGPLDKTPPEVVSTYPTKDSLFVPVNLQTIDFRFSEVMDQLSVTQNIFISPQIKYQTEWESAVELRLNINDTLLADQTYVVSVGSGASDDHGNKMDKSYQFAFSTGSKIDDGSIRGKIYGQGNSTVYSVFTYPITDTTVINPLVEQPLYISQTTKEGEIELNYLKYGRYRVFVVEDINKNMLFDIGFEQIGIPFHDFYLDSLSRFDNFAWYKIWKPDTMKPAAINIRVKSNFYIHLRLSEAVIMPDQSQFSLQDSLSGDKIAIKTILKNSENDNVLDIYCAKLENNRRYMLNIPALSDSFGNKSLSGFDLVFSTAEKLDTTQTTLLDFSPKDSSENILPSGILKMHFSRPLYEDFSAKFLQLLSSGGRKINYKQKITPTGLYQIIPEKEFSPDSSYKATLYLKQLHDINGNKLQDTVIVHNFSIISLKDMGELSGTVSCSDSCKAPVFINLNKFQKTAQGYYIRRDGNGPFKFKRITEGQYLINGYLDLDKNSKYSHGQIIPFKYAEPFYYNKDTLRVRKRWETSGIDIKLPRGLQND